MSSQKRTNGLFGGRWIWVLVVTAVAVSIYLMRPAARTGPNGVDVPAAIESTLPRLVDLGADKCVPCKMMAPILEGLKTEYAGTFTVDFIDVWKNSEAGKPYEIKVIPTQIFFDADGNELFRHEGFYSKEDILAKWRELGVEI